MTLQRHRSRLLSTLGAVALTALAAACADAPTAPQAARTTLAPTAAPSLEVVSPAVYATGLTREVPLLLPVTTTFTVGKDGLKLSNLPGGLSISITGGTFAKPTTLSVTALPGGTVAYEFQPHGLQFKKGIWMAQDIRGTNLAKLPANTPIEIGYFADKADLSVQENKALVREFLRAEVDRIGNRITWNVFHFSGYMVSTGRVDEAF